MQVLDLENFGRRHWRILGCSAVTGAGLLQGFDCCFQMFRAGYSCCSSC